MPTKTKPQAEPTGVGDNMSSTLPPYASQRFCPKCLYADVSAEYGSILPSGDPTPHLRRTCKRCGYGWLEQCASEEQIKAREEVDNEGNKAWKEIEASLRAPRQFLRTTRSGREVLVWGTMAKPPPYVIDDPRDPT